MGSRAVAIASHFEDTILLGAEVGVRYGKNAKALLDLLPGLRLYLIDTWAKPKIGDSYYGSGDNIAQRPPGYWKKCFPDFLQRIDPYTDRVSIERMLSLDAAEKIKADIGGSSLDFVFLDADHSYEGVCKDIVAWMPLVKPGGYLCGHDYNHPRIGEVKQAVDKLLGDNIELCDDMTWFFKVGKGR